MPISCAEGLAYALFEESGDALFLIDPDTDQVLDVNPTAERLTQLPREQLLAQPVMYWFRFAGKGGRQRLQDAVSRSGIFHSQEGFLLRTPDEGVWIPVNLTVSRLHVKPRTLALITARDVREQREAQTRLRESHALLQAITEGTTDAIFVKDLQGCYLMINPAGAHFLGKTVQDVLGKDDTQLFTPASARLIMEDDRAVLASGQTQTYEERATAAGITRTYLATKGPYRDAQGNVIGLIGISRDITDRKQAEEELLHERYLLSSLMNTVPDCIYFKDTASRILRVNRAWAEHTGCSNPDAALGKTDFDLFTEEHARQAFEDEQEIIRTGQAIVCKEEKETWPDGEDTWVSTTKMPLRDAEGRVIGTFGISRDITARKRAEEAVRKAEERARLLLECSGEGIYGIDEKGRCTFINRAAARMLGYRAEEVLGQKMHERCHHHRSDGSPYPVEECPIYRVMREGKACRVDHEVFWRSDGSSFPVAYTSSPLGEGGAEVRGAVVTFTDFSAWRKVEAELRKARLAAEGASRAKSEFLANMSHEIRTPMNGILGMTELALETELTPRQREYLNLVKISAESLLAVINDILDFSKIEAGKLQLDPVPFYLRDSLGDTMKTLGLRAQQKGLELAYHVNANVPEGVVGDSLRLRQVLVNLVGNAIKFTEEGEVVVRVQVRERSPGEVVLLFVVRDTGIGIPAEKQGRIFEAFAQADSSTTRQYGGSGLGLTISSRLVERMGGRIWVESEPGRGSSFHFTARLGLHEGDETRASRPRPASLRGLNVLVVDDNATNRYILQEILANWSMTPTVVEGARQALAELKRAAERGSPYALVLLDAMMPHMDGLALAEEIRRHRDLDGTTLLLLSSAGRPDDAARCRQLGIAACLTKPVKQSELLDAIVGSLGKLTVELRPAPAAPRSGPRQGRGLRILLAEDNAVNQTLATILLEKEGHEVVLAVNGKEAVEAAARQPFDVVLMDVQMPEMDGLEATRIIRAREHNGTHVPIIALTAHAMKGDRERCLQAGADGYVSKPLQAQELYQAIDSMVQTCSEPAPAVAAPAASAAPELEERRGPAPIDREDALRRVGGDATVLHELAGMFLEEYPQWMTAMGQAIRDGDALQLHRAAHTFKGSVGIFAAHAAFEAALRLETLGRTANLTGAAEAYAELKKAVAELEPALRELASTSAGGG
jgi:PAS domain S-box-containing protein